MPRIYNSASEPLDYCRKCFSKLYPTEEKAFADHGGKEDGPDGRGDCFGYDCEHPDYAETDYTCEQCNTPLTDRDNHWE